MKTTRRHDLQTNELSQQIAQVWTYAKEHATVLTVVIVGAAVLITGASWYFTQQSSELQDGWARLAPRSEDESTASLVSRYQKVASENIDPAITRAAWLGAADEALGALINPKKADDPATETDTPDRAKLMETATTSYTRARELAGDDLTAYARATWGLALVAEESGELERATKLYEAISEDTRLEPTGLCAEAKFRMANLTVWAEEIEFAPPLMLVLPEETGSTATGTAAPSTTLTPIDVTTDPRFSVRKPDPSAAPANPPAAATDAKPPANEAGTDQTGTPEGSGPAAGGSGSESKAAGDPAASPPPEGGNEAESNPPAKSAAGADNGG